MDLSGCKPCLDKTGRRRDGARPDGVQDVRRYRSENDPVHSCHGLGGRGRELARADGKKDVVRVYFNLGLDQRTSINVRIWMTLVGAMRW